MIGSIHRFSSNSPRNNCGELRCQKRCKLFIRRARFHSDRPRRLRARNSAAIDGFDLSVG
jgi:hypothetical protein